MSIWPVLFFAVAVLAGLVLFWKIPFLTRLRRVGRIFKGYRRMRARGTATEEEIWSGVADRYFTHLGWKKEKTREVLATLKDSCRDFHERQDTVATEKESAKELARRILICQYGESQTAVNVREAEKIYQLVEIAAQKFFPE